MQELALIIIVIYYTTVVLRNAIKTTRDNLIIKNKK